jgi:RNA polymerase sigma-70 factor (ECF subfamily)
MDASPFGAAGTRSTSRVSRRAERQKRADGRAAADAALTVDLESARAGDEAAFARLYRAVQPGLLRYLTALVGRDAEDVASEAWSHACRGLGNFRGDIDGFRGWLATIARHRAIDHLRAQGRRPADPVPTDELHDRPADRGTEDVAFETLSTTAAIEIIKSLPPDQAEAVLLRAVMGLDAKTAGHVLGKRAGAVRAAAFRGLQNLAARFESEESGSARPGHNTFPASDADEMR